MEMLISHIPFTFISNPVNNNRNVCKIPMLNLLPVALFSAGGPVFASDITNPLSEEETSRN